MSDNDTPPENWQVGSRDFYWQASELLQNSDTGHMLICGFDGCKTKYRSSLVSNPAAVEWLRAAMNELCDDLLAKMKDGGEGHIP